METRKLTPDEVQYLGDALKYKKLYEDALLQVEGLQKKLEDNKVIDCEIINAQTKDLREKLEESKRLIGEARALAERWHKRELYHEDFASEIYKLLCMENRKCLVMIGESPRLMECGQSIPCPDHNK